MYVHLGGEKIVNGKEIVAILDFEKTTTSKTTREFLKNAEKKGRVRNVSSDLPKSYVITKECVYISQISPATLLKRNERNG
ncbi:MAG: DUF370 domain-containing protein [Clostridia bacterium]|nr:DUF370 domain-containing protein [Clostridia bacterium]